ncbi:MAG TPA: hypothetical protein VGG06_08945 [Thermoanaerobaculia bacterium]
MEPGSIVIVHLAGPTEKYWGVLETIAVHGVTLRCLNVESFDDWTRSIAYETSPSLGLATIFFPMGRVERMFLDERVGEVESLRDLFERRVGRSLERYLTGGDGS